MLRTHGTFTPVVSKSLVVAMKLRFGAAAQIGDDGLAIHGGHALEGVVRAGGAGRWLCPGGVKVVQGVGDEVGVMFAGAKDDGFLSGDCFRPSERPLEQMTAHGLDAVRQDEICSSAAAFVEHRRQSPGKRTRRSENR